MADNVGRVFAELGLTTTIGADLAKARAEMAGGLSSLGSGITGALTGAATAITYLGVAAGATAAVVGGVAVNSFKTFEQSVANAASVTGLTGAAFEAAKKNISEVAQTLGQETVYSSSQAADALYNLASAGWDVANMTAEELQPMLDLAAGTQTDLAETTAITTGVITAFGLAISDVGRVSDILATSTGTSAATMEKLGISFREVGPVAAMAGMSIEEVTAALGVMYDKYMTGEQAGTGLKTILRSLLNPSSEATAALQSLGLTFDDLNPKTYKFDEIVSKLQSHGLDATTAFKIFGSEGAPSILALVSSVEELTQGTETLKNSTGTAATMAKQQLDTLAGSWENMKGVLENVMINIGAALAPGLRGLAGAVADAGPGIQNAMLGIVGFFTELAGKMGPSFENLKTIGRELSTVFGDIFNSMTGGQGNATDTIAGIFNGITGAVADAIPKIWTGINKVIDVFGQLKDALGPTIENVKTTIENLLPALSSLWEAIKPEVALAIGAIVTGFNLLSGAIATVTKFAAEHPTLLKFVAAIATLLAGIAALPGIVTAVKAAMLASKISILASLGAIKGGLAILAGPVGIAIALIALLAYAWANDWGGIREKAAAAWDNIKMTLDKFFAGVEKFCIGLIEAWDRLKTNLGEIWNLLVTACETFYTNLQTIWNNIQTAISNAAATIQTTLENWRATLQGIYDSAKQAVLDLYTYFQTQWTALYNYLVNIANQIWTTLQTWYNDLVNVFNQVKTEVQNLYNEWQARWQAIYQALSDAYNNIVTTLQNLVTEAGNKVSEMRTAIENGISGIVDKIKNFASDFYNAGVAMLQGLYDGVKEKFDEVISLAEGLAEDLRGLMPDSPAKWGPFHVLPNWSAVIDEPLDKAIKKLPAVKSALLGQLSGLRSVFNTVLPGQLNLSGNLQGFTAALHKILDSPASTGSSQTSGGGTWSRTSSSGGQTTTQSGNMTAAQAQELLKKLNELIQAQAPVITIKDVKLDQDYNFQKLVSDIEKYQTSQRRQRGAYL